MNYLYFLYSTLPTRAVTTLIIPDFMLVVIPEIRGLVGWKLLEALFRRFENSAYFNPRTTDRQGRGESLGGILLEKD